VQECRLARRGVLPELLEVCNVLAELSDEVC
jgi:hypothetical protein